MDEQGLRIAENQENSQKNRRKLAENTRGMLLHLLLFPNYATRTHIKGAFGTACKNSL